MEYFVYTRKSTETDEKQALSIPAQVRELKDFALKNGLSIYEVLEESKSASKPSNRPIFSDMIKKIESGVCRRILCWHTNRLSRNPMESGIIMQMLADGQLLEILTPQKSITYDNANDILLGVEFGANSQFSKELSLNTKRGLREKVLRGEWPTYAPPFYINVGTEKGRKNIIPDPNNYAFYEKLINEVITKRIPSDKAYKLLDSWRVRSKRGVPYSRNTVNRLLRNPVYYGGLVFKGMDELAGTWKPLISKTKWLQLQDVLNDKSKPMQTKYNHPYRKQIVCAKCGYSIVAYTKNKPNGKSYTYYSCSKRGGNCTNKPITAENLELQIIENLKKIKLDKNTLDYLKKELRLRLDEEMEYEFSKLENIESEYKEVSKDLDNLLKMRLAGELSSEEYMNAKEQFSQRLRALEELRKGYKYNREDIRNQLELFFENCFQIENLFINGTSEEKSQLVYALSKNLTIDDGKLGWNFKEPWSHMISVDISDENFEWGPWWNEFRHSFIRQDIKIYL